ncbi:MAG TPA: DUF4190 domain-containing protein [Gemmataceae bacterium]
MPRRDDDYDDRDDDDRPRRRRRRDFDDEDDDDDYEQESPVSTIIPYKNAMALAAYYCGVFSLIPCLGGLLGPAAFVLGILGLRYVRKHPTAHGTGHAITGIILGGITGLAHLVLVILLAVGGLTGFFK